MSRAQKLGLIAVFCAILVLGNWKTIRGDIGDKNQYIRQATAWLHGRLDIYVPPVDDRSFTYDLARFNGRYYMPFPPAPALLVLPFNAALGEYLTKGSAIAVLLSLINLAVLIRVLEHAGIRPGWIGWTCAAFFLGTAYWPEARASSGAWHFAHIAATLFMLLGLEEALGRGSGWRAGAWAGLAIMTRQVTVYGALFFAVAVWCKQLPERRRGQVLGFALALGLCGLAYLGYNALRFGNPFDTGYSYLPLEGTVRDRVAQYGMFNIAYVPFNFAYLFLQGFHLSFGGPLGMTLTGLDPYGTSLLAASPFVLAALWAGWDRRMTAAMWVSAALAVGHTLLYYNNGSLQWNAQRYTLDFLPLLLPAIALGFQRAEKDGWSALWKGAILFAVGLNAVAVWVG